MIKNKKEVEVEIKIPTNLFVRTALEAHKRKMDLNSFIVLCLRNYIKDNFKNIKRGMS